MLTAAAALSGRAHLRRLACVLAATIASSVSLPTLAFAGTYTVSGCRIGWVPDVHDTTGSAAPSAYDECDLPNARWLSAGLPASGQRANPGDYAGWRFDAPPDTSIAALAITWQGQGDYSGTDWGPSKVVVASSNNAAAMWHLTWFSLTDSISIPDAKWVRAFVICEAGPGSTCRASWWDPPDAPRSAGVYIRRASFTMIDGSAPQTDQVAGSAATDPTWTGAEYLSYSAVDRGSGIFRVLIDVDGSVVKAVPAVSDDRCVDRTGGRDFGYPVPCPTQASGTVALDAADLPAGQHVVTVYLEDAAGNRAVLMPPTQKLIVNDLRAVGYYLGGRFFNPRLASPRAFNGTGATSGATVSVSFVRTVGKGRSRRGIYRAAREVRFSQRPTVRGRVTTPAGEPIARAAVFVGQQREGREWRLGGAVQTDSDGRFSYRPTARQPNRQLRVVYFPFSDSHENAMSRPLALKVRAGVTLHVSDRSLRNRQRLTFTGRVLGQVPDAGVAVTLQAKVGRHYRSFRQLRASSRTGGHFRTVYRFERTTSPARYRFRVKLVRQAGLPYQGGVSSVVSVVVRP
jgi:hypothetical protein